MVDCQCSQTDESVVTFRGSISTCAGLYSEDNGKINNIFFSGKLDDQVFIYKMIILQNSQYSL